MAAFFCATRLTHQDGFDMCCAHFLFATNVSKKNCHECTNVNRIILTNYCWRNKSFIATPRPRAVGGMREHESNEKLITECIRAFHQHIVVTRRGNFNSTERDKYVLRTFFCLPRMHECIRLAFVHSWQFKFNLVASVSSKCCFNI